MWIVFLFLYPFGLEFLVTRAHVPRDRFVFGFRFGAFKSDNFSCHNVLAYLGGFVSVSADSATTVFLEPAPSMVPRLPSFRCLKAPSFSRRA